MTNKTSLNKVKNLEKELLRYPLKIKRDLKAWEALAGIWKGKKLLNVLRWQRNIRKEWDRKLPKLK